MKIICHKSYVIETAWFIQNCNASVRLPWTLFRYPQNSSHDKDINMLKRYLVLSVVTVHFHYLLWSMLHNKTFLACIFEPANRKTRCRRDSHSWKERDNGWLQLNTAKTDKDGRIKDCGPSKLQLRAITVSYLKPGLFQETKSWKSLPWDPRWISYNKVNEHYHVPLLLSQYGYSTIVAVNA